VTSADLPTAEQLGDRHAERWEPLLAIADLGGQEFGAKARRAAVELHRKPVTEESVELMLLRHLRDAFEKRHVDRMTTVQVIEMLLTREDEDAPWTAWWGSWQQFTLMEDARRRNKTKSIGQTFARLLKPYGIESKRLQIDGRVQVGFDRAWFEQVWRSYLP
jgi:hypothetical protein